MHVISRTLFVLKNGFMKYEIHPGINLLNCDCMDFMKEIPDKYFSLAICDPPYGIGIGTSVGGQTVW